ncbi:MAG: leucine-rich repeat domain-containing protein [Clostridiales bacterium]|nr:leucine-rich repeat domain-containing protein [Clostridiales bacterium]
MFRDCTNLRKVNIPDGVTTIEYSAFAFCFDLPWVTIPDSVEKIYSGAFIGSGIYNMTIPDGVTSIEYATFRSCDNLEWIDLPASITRIDESAFDSCENLTDVCFRGSRKQWDEITVYNGWDDKVSDKTLADIFGDADIWFDDLSIIKTQPVDFYGPYGSTAVFSVESYNEIAEYQWQYYLDGGWADFRIESATTSQLTLEVTEETVDLQVRCVLTDFSGFTETSEEACIVLIDEVNIVKQPEDLTCEPGEMATFSVEAEGEGLKYQWQVFKNGAWTNCSVKDGAKTPILTLEAKESRNESRYKCIITDKYGYSYDSAEASLLVRKALTILTQPENCSGAPGETATFTVVAEGSGLKYQWQTYKNGSWTNCSTKDGAKTATLSLEMKDSRHGSKYQCVITDKYGVSLTTKEVTMTVAKPLEIKQHPANVTGKEGEMATFKVVAEGSGLKYQWQVFKNGAWTNCSVNDGAKTDTLTLEIKASRDGSRYQCVVTDRTGASVTSNEATITARDLFILVNNPETEISAVRGTYVDFTIEAHGDGLKYQWQVFKNGKWTNCSVKDGAKTDTMTLEAKMSRDGLKYHCVVTDKYGQSQTSNDITLCVIDIVIIERSINSPEVTAPDITNFVATNYCDDTETVEVPVTEATAEVVEASEVVEIEEVIEVTEVIETVPEIVTDPALD